jgi:hypothetical protein
MRPLIRVGVISAISLASIGVVLLGPALLAVAQSFTQLLAPGDSIQVSCPSVLVMVDGGALTSQVISCATFTPTPTPTPAPTATPTNTPAPTGTSTRTPVPTGTPTPRPTSTAIPSATPSPSATPTMVMPMPTNTVVAGGPNDGALGNSAAYGIWTPTALDTCTKAEHDAFYVIGPDGLRYPTWHPPVFTRPNGTTCTFGHEHGQDPRAAAEWTITQRHYARTLADGSLDLAHAGIPFGYVNQQMDNWEVATGNTAMAMRHEDHVGHKIATVDHFQIGLASGPGQVQFFYPGVTCNYIIEYHQGTHSKDAFENNLHQVLYNGDCSDGHGIHLDSMGEFGGVGQFTRSCDSAGDRTSIITTGTDYASPAFPGTTQNGGARGISDRSCIQTGFLVPPGQFSQNAYEFWPVNIGITRANGTPVVDGLNLLFDVEDSIRYYWPGHASNGTTVDNVGYMQALCYEDLNGRRFRGNSCDSSTNYGAIQGIAWNDPRAGFRDLNRGVYFKPGISHNAGGTTVWYTDPFGGQAQTTPFPGSIKQLVTADSTNYAQRVGAFETANALSMVHDDGGRTVHAPN